MTFRLIVRTAVPLCAGALLLTTATPAGAADVPAGTDATALTAMAEQAVGAFAANSHKADLSVTLTGAMRGASGESPFSSTTRLTVRQFVASMHRSAGTAVVEIPQPTRTSTTRTTQRVVTFDGRVFLTGGEYGRQTVWARSGTIAALWLMLNPADPILRFPRAPQLVGLAAVPGEPGPYVRLRGEIADDAARGMVRRFGLGKSKLPADQNAAVDGARFEHRTIDLVIDPADGHLVETDVQLDIAVDLNLVSDSSETTIGEAVITLASRFVPSPTAAAIIVRRPSGAINLAAFARGRKQDKNAQSLLRDAAVAVERAHSEHGTYQFPLEKVARIDPNVNWVTKVAARSTRKQVEFVWGNDRGYLLATRSATGRLFTYENRIGSSVRRRCTLKGRSCGTW